MNGFKRSLLATVVLAGGMALAGAVTAAPVVEVTTYDGNDCSGVFGQGFANCVAPNGSPVIIKVEFTESFLISNITINTTLFPTITGNEFTFTSPDGGKTGTWTYNPGPGDPGITAWVAKGGNFFNYFETNPQTAVTLGSWQRPPSAARAEPSPAASRT